MRTSASAEHLGVDPLSTARAFGQMVRHGGVVSGASTLTMQAVRLLEPRPRTLGSKLIEMARALQLEAHYSKDEILGIYLTLAPFGGNLEGVRAASLAYFGKEPKLLTPGEAALLVALPQSPTRLRPDRFPQAARAARDRVLLRVAAAGALDPEAAREATEQPTPAARAAAAVPGAASGRAAAGRRTAAGRCCAAPSTAGCRRGWRSWPTGRSAASTPAATWRRWWSRTRPGGWSAISAPAPSSRSGATARWTSPAPCARPARR